MEIIPPFPISQHFQIHGSKFKPDPVCHLGQTAVHGITHGVFFFCVCKDPLNGLLALLVERFILRRVAGVIG